jgi:hypothetical protein
MSPFILFSFPKSFSSHVFLYIKPSLEIMQVCLFDNRSNLDLSDHFFPSSLGRRLHSKGGAFPLERCVNGHILLA